MKKTKLCCKELEDQLRFRNILEEEYDKGVYYIYGKPSFADDSDGHSDNMTDEIKINYCPFCGAKI